MGKTTNEKLSKKLNRDETATAREFIIQESYAGKKKLSDIFADLLYSEYRRQEQGGATDTAMGYTTDSGKAC
jgi:hypothetical protein